MNGAPLSGRQAAAWGMAGLLAATVFSFAVYPNVPPASDVWDYAQEARQLARGEGFTSLYTYPVHLGAGDQPPFPVRWRMPLYAAVGAALLQVGIPLPVGFFVVGILAHGLLIGLVFLLAAHFHSARAGAIAAACAIASPILLDPYSAALSQVPVAALALTVWFLLLRGGGLASAGYAGVLAAAAWYLRGESLLMVPVWIWVASRGGRLGRGVLFLVVYAALCVPWLVALRSGTGGASPIQGNPMLLYTLEYPGYSSSRTYGEVLLGVVEYLVRHPLTFLWRFVKDAAGYGVDLLWGLGPVAFGMGLAGLLLRESKERWRSLAPTLPLLVGAAIQIAAFSCLERSPRFLVPAIPLVCVALAVAAAPVWDRMCGRRMVVAVFAVLLLERAVTLAFETREAARRFPPLPMTLAAEVAARIETAPRLTMLWTDVPDWIAWHVDRPALLLPLWRQRERVAADHPPAGVFLSPNAGARNLADGELEWARATDRGELVSGFRAPEILTGEARLYPPSD